MNPTFKKTVRLIQKLPGVGPRQAARFILALLDKDQAELTELGNAIAGLKNEIRLCNRCFNLSDNGISSEAGLCHICSDKKRDQNKILVVEKVTDLDAMEKTGLYKGLYHVLGGAISPLDGLTIENLRFKELERRINNNSGNKNVEMIIATNPSTSGETTALYINELFGKSSNISLTRLARGLASGSNLEYADESTLRNALENRK